MGECSTLLFGTPKCHPEWIPAVLNTAVRRELLQAKPFLQKDEGPRVPFLGTQVFVKASTEQTGGTFNLFDVVCPRGFATPVHIHYAEDVVVIVLEGEVECVWGDEGGWAGRGSTVFQPRGTPHGFRVQGDGPARILYMTVPGGLDRLVRERATLSRNEFVTAVARHKIEVLGPLPER